MTTLRFWRFGKNKGFLAFLFLIIAGSIQADWVLRNTFNGVLHFLLVPMGEDGKIGVIDQVDEAKAFLKEKNTKLERIPPYSFLRIKGEGGPALLLGFYVSSDRPAYPLVRAKLPSASGEPVFVIGESDLWKGKSGQHEVIYPWELELPDGKIRIDNRYLEWRTVPEVKAFNTSFVPDMMIRYRGGASEKVLLSQSKEWPSKGSAVESVKIVLGIENLFLMISAFSPLGPSTSYWFYLRPEKIEGSPGPEPQKGSWILAVEIPIVGKGGPILLWIPNTEKPIQIGTYTAELFQLEGEIESKYLPDEVKRRVGEISRILMSVVVQGREGAEEFFLTEFSPQDIPLLSEIFP
jgi:hypothetical protein